MWAAVAQLGLPTPNGVDGDIEAIAQILADSDGSLALSSGDPSAVNCKIFPGAVRFFDFEEACFRHALADATVLRFLSPTGAPPWRLPQEIALSMEMTYRTELALACALAQDDRRYEQGMAAAVAAWTIVRLARLPKMDVGPDRNIWLALPPDWSQPAPARSRKRQLVAILEVCVATTRRAAAFDAFAAWCERLADALRKRWPEGAGELPLYPAFLNEKSV
ncbi:hypothetical protein CCAX7_44700 [Capsulimonas corticalis]|uniref:Uncharacterized protein n=1 Tax=Capsulimonas corticalis TaxID=2219043 RepID=A0A402CX29_9BACT|nr:hypothetical protein CCAX7_44700 [Capsulimonas corticalis]